MKTNKLKERLGIIWKLPHINRKFTAPFYHCLLIVCFIFLLTIIGANLLYDQFYPSNEEKKLRLAVMNDPANYLLHEKLGQYYLNINENEAEKEYLLAEEFYREYSSNTPHVLGSQSTPWQTWTNITMQKNRLEEEVRFWESVHQDFSNYIYAPIRLASLHQKLGNIKKAQEYLEEVLKESPTNEFALKLKGQLR